MTRMTDDLLEAARVVTGTLPATRHPLDLRPIVTAAVRDIQAAHPGLANLRVTVPATPVTLNGDPVRLAQMIANLLDNANKHTPPGTPVDVELTADGRHAILCVRDAGPGLPPGTAARLFDPFVRAAAPGITAHAGLGLGLAVVRGIAELHDGTAAATSSASGATLTIRLPLTDAPPADGQQHTGPAPARPPLRILVVEDNTDLAAMYATLLRYRGDLVTVATTGTGALDAAREPFDLILCDLALGGDIDGYQIGRRLRRGHIHRHTRLVAVSGFTQAADRERSRAAGFDAHLAKPLDLADLDRLLTQWTGNWTRPPHRRTGRPLPAADR
jgi:CheY-like chemotaxis protein